MEPVLQSFLSLLLELALWVVFPAVLTIYHIVGLFLFFLFSLYRHLWICAASLPVRIKARVSRLEPRLDVSVPLAGLVLTVMCPMSHVKWQLHKGVNKRPLWFSWKRFPVHHLFAPPFPIHLWMQDALEIPENFISKWSMMISSKLKNSLQGCIWETRLSWFSLT